MLTKKILIARLDLPENDELLEIVPRRQSNRRISSRRAASKPKIACPDTIRLLRKQDKTPHLILREGERRKLNRRNSKPSLLNTDEILILRKS